MTETYRNFTAEVAKVLLGTVACWYKWSNFVGLLENVAKTRLIAKNKANCWNSRKLQKKRA